MQMEMLHVALVSAWIKEPEAKMANTDYMKLLMYTVYPPVIPLNFHKT